MDPFGNRLSGMDDYYWMNIGLDRMGLTKCRALILLQSKMTRMGI